MAFAGKQLLLQFPTTPEDTLPVRRHQHLIFTRFGLLTSAKDRFGVQNE